MKSKPSNTFHNFVVSSNIDRFSQLLKAVNWHR